MHKRTTQLWYDTGTYDTGLVWCLNSCYTGQHGTGTYNTGLVWRWNLRHRSVGAEPRSARNMPNTCNKP